VRTVFLSLLTCVLLASTALAADPAPAAPAAAQPGAAQPSAAQPSAAQPSATEPTEPAPAPPAKSEPASPEPPSEAAEPASPAPARWEGDDEIDWEEDTEEPAPAFESPHIRVGLHPHAGVVFGDDLGGFGGLELLLGTRIWSSFSLLTRLQGDVGAWDHPQSSLYLSGSAGLGGEYLVHDFVGPGTRLALGLTVDAWLRGACQTPTCLPTLLPSGTAHVGLMFAGVHDSTLPLSTLSIGVSGGAGYDPVAESMAGRLSIYFGYDFSERVRTTTENGGQ